MSIEEIRVRTRMGKDRFILELLGARLTQVEKGYALVELDLNEHHLNGIGIVQGGVLYSLGDYACAAAGNYAKESLVSLDSSISYLKSVAVGTIRVEAHEYARSKHFSCTEAKIWNQDNVLLATMKSRGYLIEQ